MLVLATLARMAISAYHRPITRTLVPAVSVYLTHYDNTPMQYTAIFTVVKMVIFR